MVIQKRIVLCALILLISAAHALGSTCSYKENPSNVEWSPENYTFPNSLCIFPDGRSSLEDAVHGNAEIVFLTLMEWSWSCDCWHASSFLGRGLLLGDSNTNLNFCGLDEPFLSGCDLGVCVLAQIPVFGGGHSEVDLVGNPIASAVVVWAPGGQCGSVDIDLFFNSPDINGDLVVNLADCGLFSSDFHGDYNYRSDFNFDGIITLVDLGVMSQAMGVSCP